MPRSKGRNTLQHCAHYQSYLSKTDILRDLRLKKVWSVADWSITSRNCNNVAAMFKSGDLLLRLLQN